MIDQYLALLLPRLHFVAPRYPVFPEIFPPGVFEQTERKSLRENSGFR